MLTKNVIYNHRSSGKTIIGLIILILALPIYFSQVSAQPSARNLADSFTGIGDEGPLDFNLSTTYSQDSDGFYIDQRGNRINPRHRAMNLAIIDGNIANVRQYLESGVPTDAGRNWCSGNTALHWASFHGHTQIAEMLLKYARSLDNKRDLMSAQNNDGLTPLHMAAQHGHTQVVRLLVNNGAFLRMRSIKGLTPLWKALYAERFVQLTSSFRPSSAEHEDVLESIRLLVRSGASFLDKNVDGVPVLHFALKNATEVHGTAESRNSLLGFRGAELEQKRQERRADLTRSHAAAVYVMLTNSRRDQMSALRRIPVAAELVDQNGNNPFHIAAGYALPFSRRVREGTWERVFSEDLLVRLLVEHRAAGIDSPNASGQTPLLRAAQAGNVSAFKFLLKSNVNCRATDNSGRTWRDLAAIDIEDSKERELVRQWLFDTYDSWAAARN